VHYLWLVKIDIRPPLAYAAVLALLLGVRLWYRFRPRLAAAGAAANRGAVRPRIAS
jgi:sulfoxide reductase heme-binding subunit YedZ